MPVQIGAFILADLGVLLQIERNQAWSDAHSASVENSSLSQVPLRAEICGCELPEHLGPVTSLVSNVIRMGRDGLNLCNMNHA